VEVEVPGYEIEEQIEISAAEYLLLIVDMQNDFVHPDGALYNPKAEKSITKIKKTIERARTAGMPVWFTRDTHREDDPEFDVWGEHVVEGSFGWEIAEELKPEANDRIIDKAHYDAFFETELEEKLKQQEVNGLIIAGTVANICIHYTAASAALRSFEVIHPVDLISALTDFDYYAALHQANWLFQARLVESKNIKFV